MSELGDAAGAILALLFGGFLFIVVGSALGSQFLFVDFTFWGFLYLLAGVVLGIAVVIAFLRALLGGF